MSKLKFSKKKSIWKRNFTCTEAIQLQKKYNLDCKQYMATMEYHCSEVRSNSVMGCNAGKEAGSNYSVLLSTGETSSENVYTVVNTML